MASNQEIKDKVAARFGRKFLPSMSCSDSLFSPCAATTTSNFSVFSKMSEGLECNFLMDLFGVDYMEMGGSERYAVMYNLYSLQRNHRLRVRAWVPENDPRLASVAGLWSAADWAEREAYDMYGITFAGHPNMTRILCPDDFSGFPLRKDFPLEGVGYRENFEKIENPKTK